MNLAQLLVRTARQRPAHPAVAQGASTWSYEQLLGRVAALATSLTRDLEVGDRVGILQWNGPQLLETLLACFHGGFCAVPVNARLTPREAVDILAHARVGAVVFAPEYADHVEALEVAKPGIRRICLTARPGAEAYEDVLAGAGAHHPPADTGPDSIAWLFYTSGTTGRMKGAMLTHRNLLEMVMAYLADVRDATHDDVVLHAAPLTHGSGLYALPPLARGATQLITTSRSYDPSEVLATIERRQVTDIAFLAPTMVKLLVEENDREARDTSSLRNIVYGGAPMHAEDTKAALARFGPVFTQIYGQAEAPVTISRLTREDHARGHEEPDLLVSAGSAYTNIEMGVSAPEGIVPVGEGEVVTRSDVVMRGYWDDQEATANAIRGGWLHTGDVGRIDASGYLYLLDRDKDVIISGGANIYPREVEEVILEHPAVRAVAVVGAPDDRWGERVVAVLSLHKGVAEAARVEAEIAALCRERLAGYKQPRQFDRVDALPTSPYGKILKREIRASYWHGRERQI